MKRRHPPKGPHHSAAKESRASSPPVQSRARLLFQRVASNPGSVGSDLEREITQAMLSEVDWVVEQLERLRDDECADAWRVWRLRELADYCRRSPSLPPQVKAFADFLAARFSGQVRDAAAECIRLLLPPAQGPILHIPATIEWCEGESAVVRFQHPTLGVVEREFDRWALPSGAEVGSCFELAVELDNQRRVIAYRPMLDRLEKRAAKEWEAVPVPQAPRDLNDQEEMTRYNKAMDEYMVQTTAMRARDAERWRAAPKLR